MPGTPSHHPGSSRGHGRPAARSPTRCLPPPLARRLGGTAATVGATGATGWRPPTPSPSPRRQSSGRTPRCSPSSRGNVAPLEGFQRLASHLRGPGVSFSAHVSAEALMYWRPMADRKDLEFTYSLIDRIFRLSLGELADFSGAKYDGDFSLTLEEAQRRKHDYVAEQIGIGPGRRVLDLGCGWGPLLDFVRARGRERARRHAVLRAGRGVPAQRPRRPPLRRAAPHRDTFGPFDAVASLGAFEHFCSPRASYAAGRQDDDLPRPVRARRERASRPGPLLPPDDGLRTEHDPARPGRHRRSARIRRVVPGAAGAPVPRLLPPVRPGADHRAAPSRTSASCRARAAGSTTSRRSASGASGLRSRA